MVVVLELLVLPGETAADVRALHHVCRAGVSLQHPVGEPRLWG